MTTSNRIRALALEGVSTADIARQLNIRYQHAYKVLKDAEKLPARVPGGSSGEVRTRVAAVAVSKPPLSVDDLMKSGFELSARWIMSSAGALIVDKPLPKDVGVYAFVKDGVALYVGVATMGLAKRLYFYGKPGISQRTSLRINETMRNELLTVPFIEIYTATPKDLEWNGLPVHGAAGLELGLIKKFLLPWNMRSSK